MMYPLVRELAADRVPVTVTCGDLGRCRQAYYRWLASPVTDRDWEDAHLIDAMLAIHADDPEFGYRFIADELGRVGMRTGENRVQRLCAQQQIFSATTRKEGDVRSVLSRRSTTSWSAAATTLPNLTGSG